MIDHRSSGHPSVAKLTPEKLSSTFEKTGEDQTPKLPAVRLCLLLKAKTCQKHLFDVRICKFKNPFASYRITSGVISKRG
ncbi:hypothetical protein L596_004468 [Steinernema carpocapsae]|uniref:Uncharacterized protein n=1 Tax=Steinernema carpocapsae TaxID=34508 RepID=A0A4U8UXF2_STECR|nr:hypothetical protein L596_004468 [Steinernema carpocapsae]